ncbi:cell filamentation protein [Chryseomicrobium aureum]|uniref:Fic/DOC family protein n=1 Tax=Chryseomicrobium aureum TaxID=1441723 RepID=UPI00195B7EEC|nr:Fic family protein [Chryseomicrobium aureum]MBM7706380.1 cell filamentation protein [Chryseomicrobium aureum]
MEKYNFGSDESYLLQHNLLGIDDLSEFQLAEQYVFTVRALQIAQGVYKIRDFKMDDLCALHKHLFQDIYSFAGEVRSVQLTKGNTRFCQFQYIDSYGASIIGELALEKDWNTIEFASEKLAYYKSELNMLHPFREGNGRTLRIFIRELEKTKGYDWDFEKMDKEDYMNAMIRATSDSTELKRIFLNTLHLQT